MAISYQHAMQFHGRPVIAHCHDGARHHGIIRHVTRDGIWMQPLRGTGALASDNKKDNNMVTADKPKSVDGENVYFGGLGFGFGGFWPGAFFLPFLALAALSPLLWW